MLASEEKIRIFSGNIRQEQIFSLSLYFVYLGFRDSPKNAVPAWAAAKRVYTFSTLAGIFLLLFFKPLKTMRLMPSGKQTSDFLAYSRTGGFRQNTEKCIEPFFHFHNSKGFAHKLISTFFYF